MIWSTDPVCTTGRSYMHMKNITEKKNCLLFSLKEEWWFKASQWTKKKKKKKGWCSLFNHKLNQTFGKDGGVLGKEGNEQRRQDFTFPKY